MRFGSVCSGIEAASVAWHPLGWQAAWLAEIEPFPAAVLAHHYPEVPNLGDMTALPARIRAGEIEAPDVFCGGTPCQAFSVAGLRRSLDDARGNLSLMFCEIADAIDAKRNERNEPATIVFWENVPGVLSTKDNAFGCFLAGLAGEDAPLEPPGGKWTDAGYVSGPKRAIAWRTLDAQYFGLAQRRKRVFVVASAREGFDPAAVLFEFEGVRRDTAPSREAREVAPTIPSRSTAGGGLGTDWDCDGKVITQPYAGAQPYTVANCLTQRMHKGINTTLDEGQTPVLAFHPTQDPISSENVCRSIGANKNATAAVAWSIMPQNSGRDYKARQVDVLQPLMAAGVQHGNQGGDIIQTAMQVRRLTPVECERLQGFPDDYTAIPWRNKPADQCPDGPRYKALGNSWAVPVVRWIGERIQRAVMT